MLKPLYEKSPNQQSLLPPPRTCEACQKIVAIGHDAINCIIVIGSPGHPSLAPFQCGHEEHWACSIECWAKVAHACVDEHMAELLKQKHSQISQL